MDFYLLDQVVRFSGTEGRMGNLDGKIWLRTVADSVANVGGRTHEPVPRCPLDQICQVKSLRRRCQCGALRGTSAPTDQLFFERFGNTQVTCGRIQLGRGPVLRPD
jgi:hypothetical protein